MLLKGAKSKNRCPCPLRIVVEVGVVVVVVVEVVVVVLVVVVVVLVPVVVVVGADDDEHKSFHVDMRRESSNYRHGLVAAVRAQRKSTGRGAGRRRQGCPKVGVSGIVLQ